MTVKRVVATFLVILSLFRILLPGFFPNNFDRSQVETLEKRVTDPSVMSKVDTAKLGPRFELAGQYVDDVENKYPLVAPSLELGSTWVKVAGKLLGLYAPED